MRSIVLPSHHCLRPGELAICVMRAATSVPRIASHRFADGTRCGRKQARAQCTRRQHENGGPVVQWLNPQKREVSESQEAPGGRRKAARAAPVASPKLVRLRMEPRPLSQCAGENIVVILPVRISYASFN